MASRRYRGRSPPPPSGGKGRFERRDELIFDDHDERLDAAALSARERIKLENAEFDQKVHRSTSRNRQSSPGRHSKGRMSKDHSRSRSHRSHTPHKKEFNGNNRRAPNSRERRRSRSKVKCDRDDRERNRQRRDEKLQFESSNDFHDYQMQHFNDDFIEHDFRMGRTYSSPRQQEMEFPNDGGNLHIELKKPNYNREELVQYPGFHGISKASQDATRQNIIPSLMDRLAFRANHEDSFVDHSQQPDHKRKSDIVQTDNENNMLIPEFNPEFSNISSYDWIKLIEDKNWQKDEMQYIMTSRLAGYARQWYLNTGVMYKNWNELKAAFLQVFPTEMSYFNLLTNMLARVKEDSDTMTTYFHHKVALLNACEIQGHKAVSCIIAGLPNKSLQIQAKAQNFEDPDELYLFLRSYDAECNQNTKSHHHQQQLEKDRPFTNRRCFNCKEIGHVKAICPKLNGPSRSGGGAEDGAIQIDKSMPLVTNNKVMYGSLSHKPTFKKYFTEVNINGITLKAYYDQASNCTTIREASATQLKLPVKKEYKIIRGFGGNSFSSIGVVEVALCIDRAIANIQLCVIPDHLQAIPIIVGHNFAQLPQIMLMNSGGDKVRFYQRLDGGKTNFDY